MTCPACGAAVPQDARFCPSCGHALVARPDERRVVTVLFADLVGFTTFSESADPEAVKDLVDRCFDALALDITEFGGQVDKVVGDAIVALFGAPVAHEDDAERAVRAALRMQATLGRLQGDHGLDVQMRVGVNTGEVLVGALRAGGDYTAMGDVVNIASRLQATAAPGQVLVGPVTHEGSRRAVRYEALGALPVKGREAPVPAHVALEAVTHPGQRRLRSRAPLVGRASELAVLRSVLDTAITRRRAHLVLVTGEAGVGKSRLAAEIGEAAECAFRATVLTGHCIPYGEANVWWPLAEALRQAVGLNPEDGAETARERTVASVIAVTGRAADDPEVARVADGLQYLLGHGLAMADVDPARARDEAARSLLMFLEAIASDRPLVLTLSDLHWADDLVLELVDRVLAGLRTWPFLLVATTRPELEGRWSPRAARHNVVQLHVEALEPAATEELATRVLGEGATPELVTLLRDRSGGNPFFVEELAAVLVEGGAPNADPTFDLRGTHAGAHRALPATLRGLVAARLDALGTAERTMLEDCAIVGPAGPIDLVLALGEGRGAPADAIDVLTDKDFLVVDGGGYAFRNDLVREVTYGTLTKAERARRHEAAARLLEGRVAEERGAEDRLDQLAHHHRALAELLAELGTVEGLPADAAARAAVALEDAAERAERAERWNRALRFLALSLAVDPNAEPADRLRRLLRRAQAHAEIRDLGPARADLDAATALAETIGDARARLATQVVMGDVQFKERDLEAATTTLEGAVRSYRSLDDPRGLADALRQLGMVLLFRDRLDDAEAAISEALEVFRSIEVRRGEAWALQNLAWIAFYRGLPQEADRRLDESAIAFAEVGDWGGLSWALGLQAFVRFNQGRLEEAERIATDVLAEMGGATGNRWGEAMMEVLLAHVAVWTGRATDGVARAQSAQAVFLDIADDWGVMQVSAPLSRALACLGRLDEAYAVIADAHTATATITGSASTAHLLLLGAVAIHAGDVATAARTCEELDQLEAAGFGGLGNQELETTRGLVALQDGRAQDAIAALERAKAGADSPGPAAAAGCALALAYAAAGRVSDAEVEAERVMSAPVGTYLDRLRAGLARGLARSRDGDEPGARAAFTVALEVADATDSLLDRAVVRLAYASGLAAVGAPDAHEMRTDAIARLERLDVAAPGWHTAFRAAAGAP